MATWRSILNNSKETIWTLTSGLNDQTTRNLIYAVDMKTITSILSGLLIIFTLSSRAQNAPVTICGNMNDCNSNLTVPVYVTNFNDIGAISLTLDYDYSKVQVTGVLPDVNLSGFSADWTSNPGRLTMAWYGTSGVTLLDNSVMVEISFTGLGVGDATDLTWVDNGTSCEYAKFNGGTFTVLNDSPEDDYYFDGHIAYIRPGPVTFAPNFSAPSQNQDVCIPFIVNQFSDIGSVSLTLDYNPAVLTFQSINSSTIPAGWSLQGYSPVPGRLIVGGLGTGFSLPDGSVLFNACFHYTCGTTNLTWWQGYSTSCEYADGTTLIPLCDNPASSFYIDGRVTNGTDAPITTCGTVTDCNSNTTVPVEVTNFRDIGAISLTLDYDYTKVQVTGVLPNVNLPGFSADWTSNQGRLTLAWYGSSGVTLSDPAVLAEITFTGLSVGDATDLTWFDNGTSCEYAKFDCGELNVLNDSPQPSFYINGHLGYVRPGPITTAPNILSPINSDICLPITVSQFNDIGGISLTLDYDPAILTFLSINTTTVPWGLSGNSPSPGKLVVGGYGPGFSLSNGSVLFNACFHFNYLCGNVPPGTTPLTWNNQYSSSCEYADGQTLVPLCDNPPSTYYINGSVGAPSLVADFSVDNTTPATFSTVTFTDLSTGNPTAWDWSFDKPVNYVNGTNSHSKNPQVQFSQNCLYTVTLVAYNTYPYCSDTKVKVGYIRVGTHGLWTGAVSSDWYTPGNWDDCIVPDASTDVTIPALAPNWPIYTYGDFTIGAQCKTITLNAPTSHFTVTGNLNIP